MGHDDLDSEFTLKQKIFLIMGRPNQYFWNKVFNSSLLTLILLNVCCVILETVPSIASQYGDLLHLIEMVSLAIFVVEYGLRVWVCDQDQKYSGGLKGRLKYCGSSMALIDMVAILPTLLFAFLPIELIMFRAVRLFRLVRLLKLVRYSMALYLFLYVLKKKKPELVISFFIGMVAILVSSSLMYFVEHSAQPEKFSSIPQTMWWAVSTLTTIGYGDVYPITPLGKFLGAMVAFLGVGLFALPAAVLASGFNEYGSLKDHFESSEESPEVHCIHCGQKINEAAPVVRKVS